MLDALDRELFLLVNVGRDAHHLLIGAGRFFAVYAHWLLLVLVAGYAIRRWTPLMRPLATAVLAIGLGSLACELIGQAWDRPRPFEHGLGFLHLLHAPSPSFPSSHATAFSAVAVSFLLAAGHRVFGQVLLVLAVLVAVSRVVVGVHYPLDVTFGVLLGCLSAMAAHYLIARAGRLHRPRGMIGPPQASGKEEQ